MQSEELISKLSACSGISNEQAESLLLNFTNTLKNYCLSGDAVAIPGFGTFQPVKRDEWISEDAATGQRWLNPPSVTVELKSSIVLRKKLLG